jgi:hypothetical protein
MRRLDVYVAHQVGDGPGHLEHPAKGTCAQSKLGHRTSHLLYACIVMLAEIVSFARTQISFKRIRWYRRSVVASVRGRMTGSGSVIKVLPALGGPLSNAGETLDGSIHGLCLAG